MSFCVAVAAVILHFRHHWDWLLLLTAAGPAAAGALHRDEIPLGIALSQDAARTEADP